jgi:hypothetical protein
VAAVVAFLTTRWLPVAQSEEWGAVEASSESAAAALVNGNGNGHGHGRDEAGKASGEPANGLDRIATLLEEIEARRAAEATRKTA